MNQKHLGLIAPPGTIPVEEYAKRRGVSSGTVRSWLTSNRLDYELKAGRRFVYIGAEPAPSKIGQRICK